MAVASGQLCSPHLSRSPLTTPGKDMRFELARLQSFAYWVSYDRASPISLAKAGFVYTGNADIVTCFVCQIARGAWTKNMNPMNIHAELSPECRFCCGEEGLNVPIFVPEGRAYQEILENLHRQFCGTDTPTTNSAGLLHQTVDSSNYYNDNNQQRQTSETRTNFPVVATDSGAPETSRQEIGIRGALGQMNNSERAPSRENVVPMKQEFNRFASFDASWPRQDTPDPRDLARAGFYYTGTVDRVQCVFCRGILRNWDEDDVPMEEHRRHFPMCPFVMGLDVGNIPDPTAIIAANRTGEFMSVTQPSAVVSDASLGIVTERPKHSQYAVEAARVTSFRNWPSGKEQTPQMLAKAGFFYAGFGDSVKCFFCDGGLRTWERGDIPWIEHALWYPRCPYVRQVKGEDFIRAAMAGSEPSSSQTASNDLSRNPSQVAPDPTAGRTVEPKELSEPMASPLVQSVLSLDIPREKVVQAIQNRLQDAGDDFTTVEDLMDAIYRLSDQTPAESSSRLRDDDSGYSSVFSGEKGGDSEDAVISPNDDETQSLLKENEELKDQRRCKICLDAEVTVVFLPCGHLVCCASCAPALRKCPICRCVIRGTVRTYMS